MICAGRKMKGTCRAQSARVWTDRPVLLLIKSPLLYDKKTVTANRFRMSVFIH